MVNCVSSGGPTSIYSFSLSRPWGSTPATRIAPKPSRSAFSQTYLNRPMPHRPVAPLRATAGGSRHAAARPPPPTTSTSSPPPTPSATALIPRVEDPVVQHLQWKMDGDGYDFFCMESGKKAGRVAVLVVLMVVVSLMAAPPTTAAMATRSPEAMELPEDDRLLLPSSRRNKGLSTKIKGRFCGETCIISGCWSTRPCHCDWPNCVYNY